ncbi:MAG TPA: fumarylacetoacetate hydrolase family protein [Woeseiaceae bacterium]|nr:fumarylacetoacetate hydrolase family protein [Woeseiaceae bacterium]
MPGFRLFRTTDGVVAERGGDYWYVDAPWDDLVNDDALHAVLERHVSRADPADAAAAAAAAPLAPIGRQEVWASGVTYFRSRVARMEESRDSGGGDFYDRVYDADRPELFFKATPARVVGPGAAMHLRSDSRWVVPEPELTLAVTSGGTIVGYTVGNDLSCRDIEGENPLYLPQAKTFDRCAALGPCLLVATTALGVNALGVNALGANALGANALGANAPGPDTRIRVAIRRGGRAVFADSTTLGAMKRRPADLVEWLFRDNSHPAGCLLMTGTGIVPPDDIRLEDGDVVDIEIDGIGILSNPVTRG